MSNLELPPEPKLVLPGGVSKRVTPKKPKLPQDPVTTDRCMAGDFRRVSCGKPEHPVHVLQYNGDKGEWEMMDDLHPIACGIIGSTIVIQQQAQAAADAEG